jgi:hypothetical protein
MATYDMIFVLRGNSGDPVINIGIDDLDTYQWYVENLLGKTVKPLVARKLLVTEYILKFSELSFVPSDEDLLALPITNFVSNLAGGVATGEIIIPRQGLNPLVSVDLEGDTIELKQPTPDKVFEYLVGLTEK